MIAPNESLRNDQFIGRNGSTDGRLSCGPVKVGIAVIGIRLYTRTRIKPLSICTGRLQIVSNDGGGNQLAKAHRLVVHKTIVGRFVVFKKATHFVKKSFHFLRQCQCVCTHQFLHDVKMKRLEGNNFCRQFVRLVLICGHNIFKGVRGFSHGRDHHQNIVCSHLLKHVSYISNSGGVFYRGPTKFEYLHRISSFVFFLGTLSSLLVSSAPYANRSKRRHRFSHKRSLPGYSNPKPPIRCVLLQP